MGFELIFQSDPLAVFMAWVSGFVGLLIFIYALGYMQPYSHKPEFFAFMALFLASMMGLIFSANLLLLYVFWELTALCSWRLIGFYRKEEDLWFADKAFIVTFFGASLMLAGIVLIYLQYGTLNLCALKGMPISNLVFFLILGGIFSKSAQLPWSGWLPDAGVAPSPVTALLHAAVLVKIGVYAYVRLFANGLQVPLMPQTTLLGVIMLSGLVAAVSSLKDSNIKRILAYSTISQLAYIFIGLVVNSAASVAAALFYILVHSIAKAGLFLTVGIIEQRTHTKDLNQLGGLLKRFPMVAVAYLLCAFGIIGLPPFGGFFSKFYLILATARAGYVLIAVVAVITAVVTLLYLMRLFNGMFLGESTIQIDGEPHVAMTGIVLICGIFSLLLGLFANYFMTMTNQIVLALGK